MDRTPARPLWRCLCLWQRAARAGRLPPRGRTRSCGCLRAYRARVDRRDAGPAPAEVEHQVGELAPAIAAVVEVVHQIGELALAIAAAAEVEHQRRGTANRCGEQVGELAPATEVRARRRRFERAVDRRRDRPMPSASGPVGRSPPRTRHRGRRRRPPRRQAPQPARCNDGTWKVLDFGIAALADSFSTLTHGGAIGTPAYTGARRAGRLPRRRLRARCGDLPLRFRRVPCTAGAPPVAAVIQDVPLRPSTINDLPSGKGTKP
jgi:hypothetical protein